jgi:hypothetical protein
LLNKESELFEALKFEAAAVQRHLYAASICMSLIIYLISTTELLSNDTRHHITKQNANTKAIVMINNHFCGFLK